MNNNYLEHHGILGQKWGVRRYQNADGSYTSLGARRHAKAADASQKDANDLKKNGYTKEAAAVQKVSDKHRAKANAIQAKTEKTKSNVKSYQKAYESASKASDKADANNKKLKEQYKTLGKNKISRVINAAKNESKEAKAYNKAYDKNMKEFEIADMKWADAKAKYANTGKTAISRIINNIKYDNGKTIAKESSKKAKETINNTSTISKVSVKKDGYQETKKTSSTKTDGYKKTKEPTGTRSVKKQNTKSPYQQERDRQKRYLATKYITNALLPGDAKAFKNMGLDYAYYKNSYK